MYKQIDDLIIRSATENDAGQLCLWWASGKVMAHAGYPQGIKTDIDKLKIRIRNSNMNQNPESEILIISILGTSDIGEMNYRKLDQNIFEIGIKICEFAHHDKGYGTKAVTLLLKYLFDERQAEKVVLDTNLKNVGAQRFYERMGFKKTAIRVDSWRNQLGELQSAVEYEMTKENFYS